MKARTLEKYFSELKFEKSLMAPVFFDLSQFLVAHPDFAVLKRHRDGKPVIEISGKFFVRDNFDFFVRFHIDNQYPSVPPTAFLAFPEPVVEYDQRFITRTGQIVTENIIKWVPYQTTLCHLGRAITEFVRRNCILKTHSFVVREVVDLGRRELSSMTASIESMTRISNRNLVERHKMSIIDKALQDMKILEHRIRESNEIQRIKNGKFDYVFALADPDMRRDADREGYEEAKTALKQLLVKQLIKPADFADQNRDLATTYFEKTLYHEIQ